MSHLFGRGVLERSDEAARPRQLRLRFADELGDSEVGDDDATRPGFQDEVGRLDVAMHDALLMRVLDGRADLLEEP